MFSDDLLSQIRSQNNVVEVVSQFVSLKKSGSGYSGLCPFHDEKTPSFHVHPLKQCYRCFGCNKGGNVFTFLMAMEGLTFPQAVEKLAKRSGVELPKESRYLSLKSSEGLFKREKAALEFASNYFHTLLIQRKEFLYARKYLAHRGITEKTIAKFQLGVSPPGWNHLREVMLKQGFTVKEGVNAGLIVLKDGEQSYDRFRNRLMFPIKDPKGQPIGFGARVLDPNDQPKYLNSPESALFSKRCTLFGIHENTRGIRLRREAIIVEGYMDVVGLSEQGVDNAVAAMGTALTLEHCQQLKALTRSVVTIFDPDKAGESAWQRSVHLLLSAGLLAQDLSLPPGKDPDEFIRGAGADEFYRLCKKAPRQINKLLKQIASKGALTDQERGEILEDLRPVLQVSALLPDRALVLDALSLVLNISIQTLENYGRLGSHPPPKAVKSAYVKSRGFGLKDSTRTKHPLDALDTLFFNVCIENPVDFLTSSVDAWAEGIRHLSIRETLFELHRSGSPENLERLVVELLHREQEDNLLNLLVSSILKGKRTGVKFEEVFTKLQERINETRLKRLTTQVRLSQRSGDDAEQIRLLDIMSQLRRKIPDEGKSQ